MRSVSETRMCWAFCMLVLVLISGCGSENTSTQGIHTNVSDEALAQLKTRETVNNMVECFGRNGFPMEKEVLYNGQVVNWVLTDRSSDCCRVKTSFRVFSSREEMQKLMMATNAASVQHGELNIAMFVPWATRTRQDCEAVCSTSSNEELFSTFMACGGQKTNSELVR